jgi:tyrosine-protein kinase Etk/Wzc
VNLPSPKDGKPQVLVLTVLEQGGYHLEGKASRLWVKSEKRCSKTVSLLVTSLSAAPGTQFTLKTLTKLEAINAMQKRLTVAESAKQSGMIALTLTGEDPDKIAVVLNTIAENFLNQNIERQEAQDSRSLTFYSISYPKSVTSWIRPKRD